MREGKRKKERKEEVEKKRQLLIVFCKRQVKIDD